MIAGTLRSDFTPQEVGRLHKSTNTPIPQSTFHHRHPTPRKQASPSNSAGPSITSSSAPDRSSLKTWAPTSKSERRRGPKSPEKKENVSPYGPQRQLTPITPAKTTKNSPMDRDRVRGDHLRPPGPLDPTRTGLDDRRTA